LETVLEGNVANQKSCKPTGLIQDACCDYQTVEQVNDDISRQLNEIIQLPFFRYQKIDLFRECPYWNEDGSCMNRACAVQETDEDHIPEAWRSGALGKVKEALQLPTQLSKTDASANNFCILDEDDPQGEGIYVDLYENPERFTGYAGASANKVWKAIYEENCFDVVPYLNPNRERNPSDASSSGYLGPALLSGEKGKSMGVRNLMGTLGLAAPRDPQDEEQCLEKRVYYRLISGLHASISIHICAEYLDQSTGEWRPNLECFISRIAEHPERLQNVYFNYVLMLRALSKISPYLKQYNYAIGDEQIDAKTLNTVNTLLERAESCQATFDENSMFHGPEAQILKDEFKSHFRNVSRIMDCVGCDKCRLWGKTQITGVATGLKILFSYDDEDANADSGTATRNQQQQQPFELKRSEIVAFIWTVHRFSESLAAVEQFREMWAHRNSAAAKAADEQQQEASPVEAADASTAKVEDVVRSPSAEELMADALEARPRQAEQNKDTDTDTFEADAYALEDESRHNTSGPSSIRLAEPAIFSPSASASSPKADEARTVGRSSYSKASSTATVTEEVSLGPRISGLLARLYDACRSSIAACLTLVERGVSFVVGTIGNAKDEL